MVSIARKVHVKYLRSTEGEVMGRQVSLLLHPQQELMWTVRMSRAVQGGMRWEGSLWRLKEDVVYKQKMRGIVYSGGYGQARGWGAQV